MVQIAGLPRHLHRRVRAAVADRGRRHQHRWASSGRRRRGRIGSDPPVRLGLVQEASSVTGSAQSAGQLPGAGGLRVLPERRHRLLRPARRAAARTPVGSQAGTGPSCDDRARRRGARGRRPRQQHPLQVDHSSFLAERAEPRRGWPRARSPCTTPSRRWRLRSPQELNADRHTITIAAMPAGASPFRPGERVVLQSSVAGAQPATNPIVVASVPNPTTVVLGDDVPGNQTFQNFTHPLRRSRSGSARDPRRGPRRVSDSPTWCRSGRCSRSGKVEALHSSRQRSASSRRPATAMRARRSRSR